MAEEFSALQRQGTWSLVPFSPNKHIVGCRWVYKIKRHTMARLQDTKQDW